MSEQDVFDSLKYRVVVVGYGTRYYYNNTGELHRDDGPAIEWINGDKLWCQNGQLHRIDGPAVERSNGAKEWYQNDQLHRIDGPAIEYANGTKHWYINDEWLSEDAFNQAVKLL